jgi:hypothetical protein
VSLFSRCKARSKLYMFISFDERFHSCCSIF